VIVLNGRLCATISVVDEFALVEASLSRLRRAYPDSNCVLLVDADAVDVVEHWQRLSDSKTSVREAFGFYRIDRGGLVVDEHLRAFTSTDADWWVKIDPDTFVRRPLASSVDSACFCGTLQSGLPRPSLQGGCIIGSREAAILLLQSRALRSPELLDYATTWAEGNGVLLRRAREHGLVSFDFVHAWACERAGLPLVNHPEINSQWLQPPADGVRYAITHPHKNLGSIGEGTEGGPVGHPVVSRLEALLRTVLPAKCVVALVGEAERLAPSTGRTVRAFLVNDGQCSSTATPSHGDEAIGRIQSSRDQGAEFFVVPASSRLWFSSNQALAKYLIDKCEVVFWQDDLAIIFDLSRPSLHGPHIDWYEGLMQ
jgi:hypothetical protein